MTGWVEHAVWWQVYPLGFTGAPARSGGAPVTHWLGHLEEWLDYARELGVSGLALGPVFASDTHGYDTIDHFRVDPRLGDEQDFARLVRAAHQRGLRILLDGVFNHVGRGFPAFAAVLREGQPPRQPPGSACPGPMAPSQEVSPATRHSRGTASSSPSTTTTRPSPTTSPA